MTNTPIKIAIQKSERMKEEAIVYLQEMGMSFQFSNRQLITMDKSNRIQLYLMRSDDIINALADGRMDIGIYGKDSWLEAQNTNLKYKNLDFSKCRMSIAVPADSSYQSMYDLDGKTIATSFKTILEKKLSKKKINATILEMSGGVEAAPAAGWADAIFDIVGSGKTLVDNGLVEKDQLFKSNAIIVTREDYIVPDNATIQNILLSKKEIASFNKVQKKPDFLGSIPDIEYRTYC